MNTYGKKWTTKSYYIGEFKNNHKQGNGYERTEDYEYEGQFHSDLKSGDGKILYYKSGESYNGTFTDNNLTGYGTYHWPNGDKYIGDFLNGQMHGTGEYLWPEGGRYVGEYLYNIKQGKGIFYWTNGRVYEGEFQDGTPHGKGIIKQFGKTYEVVFEKGKLVNKTKISQ